MPKIKLGFYAFQIGKDEYTSKYQTVKTTWSHLGNIEGKSFAEILMENFRKISSEFEDNTKKERITRACMFETYVQNNENRYFCDVIKCTLKTGEYGSEAEVMRRDKNGKFKHEYNQQRWDAPVKPFSFVIYYHKEKNIGLLVTEIIGHGGIISFLKDFLKKAIKNYGSKKNYINIISALPDAYMKKLFESKEITTIGLLTTKKNVDIVDDSQIFDYKKQYHVFKEPTVKNKHGLWNSLTSNINTLSYLTSDDEEIEDIDVGLKDGKTTKHIKFSTRYTLNVNEDISEIVTLQPNGLPTENSLFRAIESESLFYLNEMKIIIKDTMRTLSTTNSKGFKLNEQDEVVNIV